MNLDLEKAEINELHKKLKNKVLKCDLDSLRGFSQRYLINLLNESRFKLKQEGIV